MRVLHIGPLSSQHTQMAALSYQTLGYPAVFLNTRRDFRPDSVPGVPEAKAIVNPWGEEKKAGLRRGESLRRSAVLATRYMGKRDPALVGALRSVADHHSFDLVVGTWGIPVLEAMLAAQDMLGDSAFVHNVLTYPDLPVLESGFRGSFWRLYMKGFDQIQKRAYARMLASCDVRVHCTTEMLSYMKEHLRLEGPGEDIVRIERFNRAYFPTRRLPKLSAGDGGPHIVHIGATNFTGQALDNLTDSFVRMTRSGIHVHYSGGAAPWPALPVDERCLHRFDSIPSVPITGALAEFITQFDAVVIAYNVKRSYERFENSLPTRFLFALVAGVPVAVPKGLFGACERYVVDHGIGFPYESEQHLADELQDAARMEVWGANALSHSQRLSFEHDLPSFEALLNRAVQIRRSRVRSRISNP